VNIFKTCQVCYVSTASTATNKQRIKWWMTHSSVKEEKAQANDSDLLLQ